MRLCFLTGLHGGREATIMPLSVPLMLEIQDGHFVKPIFIVVHRDRPLGENYDRYLAGS